MPRLESITQKTPISLLKALHTAIWYFFAGCVLAIPFMAWLGKFTAALALIGCVALKIAILAMNSWRCPLERIAAHYTFHRRANFDIFLPAWLAKRTMTLFGPLFAIALVVSGAFWLESRR